MASRVAVCRSMFSFSPGPQNRGGQCPVREPRALPATYPPRCCEPGRNSLLLRPNVKTEDQFLIAQKQMSVRKGGVGPDSASRTGGARLRRLRCFRNLEAADFGPFLG